MQRGKEEANIATERWKIKENRKRVVKLVMEELIKHGYLNDKSSLPKFVQLVQTFEEKVNVSAKTEAGYISLVTAKLHSIRAQALKAAEAKNLMTNPSTKAKNLVTNHSAGAKNLLTNPSAEAKNLLSNHSAEAKNLVTSPSAEARNPFTSPSAEAKNLLTNPSASGSMHGEKCEHNQNTARVKLEDVVNVSWTMDFHGPTIESTKTKSKGVPHPSSLLMVDACAKPYSREYAAFPAL